MADPTPYQISYSFSGWQATNPSKPLPAQNVDNELAGVQTSIASLISAVKDVRRSDGKLVNGSVSFATLDNDLQAGYSGGAVSAWAPVVDYAAGIAAQASAPATMVYYSGETYVCVVSHLTTSIFIPSNWKKIAAKGLSGSGSGDMIAANNLSDLTSISQALANLGLDQVSNTSDANKPVSTAVQTALNAKAPLASPTFTGTPLVPTAAPGTNTTQAASTAFVQAAVSALPFTKEFISAEQAITSGGLLTLAHGLGAAPKLIQAVIICKTAEGGYSVGDIVPVNLQTSSSVSGDDNRGAAIEISSATNVTVRFGAAATATILRLSKSSGLFAAATNANWRFIMRAWA